MILDNFMQNDIRKVVCKANLILLDKNIKDIVLFQSSNYA
jgi:hypothetical protein